MKKKILFQTRANFFERKGGDTIQVLKTKQAIEDNYGDEFEIIIDNDPDIDLTDYDLVHIFNLLRPQESLRYVLNAKKQGKPVALSTIYWKSEEFERNGQIGARKLLSRAVSYNTLERLRLIYRYLFDGERHLGTKMVIKKGFENTQKIILENADVLLPNGIGEIELLEKNFNQRYKNFVVVPNAIELKNNNINNFSKREGIICVGRIEPRKNQLNLVKALSGIDIPVYIIGKVNKTQQKYFELIKKNSGDNIHFIDEVTQDELIKYYSKAKVHVLPSWYDTPGLVSLEAGYFGCNLVVGKDGTTREYFEETVHYVNPSDISEIKEIVLKSYSEDNNMNLSRIISNKYTWGKTADKTIEGYRRLI